MSYRQLIFLISLFFIGCDKNSLVYEEIPQEILFSCIDYSKVTDPNFDSDDLYAFWDLFVQDAKCSMNNSPEYDKLNSNLQNLKINLNKINLIDSYKKYKKVAYGALVKTKSSYYLISVGLGKFIIEGKNIFIISLSSPVGKSLFDKKKEESIIINDTEDKIIEIF